MSFVDDISEQNKPRIDVKIFLILKFLSQSTVLTWLSACAVTPQLAVPAERAPSTLHRVVSGARKAAGGAGRGRLHGGSWVLESHVSCCYRHRFV